MDLICSAVEYSFSLEKTFSIVKDLILTAAAISGSFVAWRGLSTWNRQLKGQNEFTLVRNILVSIYKYRDAISDVRNPMMWAHEMQLTSDERTAKNEDEIRYYESAKGFEARWKSVSEVRAYLYPSILEAEALWGNNLNDLFKPLFQLEKELLSAIKDHMQVLRNPNIPAALRESPEKLEARDATMNRPFGKDEQDLFIDKFQILSNHIEIYVKSKLPHR